MAENSANCANEAVCIDAGRIYDSCCDRDCIRDLNCVFSTEAQTLIENAVNVRARSAKVVNVLIDVEPVSFNRGYYTCDLTFFFVIDFDVITAPRTVAETVKGAAYYTKKVILFGSEGNVSVFANDRTVEGQADENIPQTTNSPRCVVQTVDPICLSAKLGKVCESTEYSLPASVTQEIGGTPDSRQTEPGAATVLVTLGLFSTVQLIRNVQMLIPVYDFCVPEKQCNDSQDSPCDVFRRIKFPIDDFFPSKNDDRRDCGCGCNDNFENVEKTN